MNMDLRSNLEVGSSRWAVRRAQWRALGLSDEDMLKPKIAIVNSSSGLAICFSHLDAIVGRLKQAVAAAGGVAFEVRTAAPSDFITSVGRDGRYILPSRDLITNDIEVAVEGAMLDGMVCLASCDKTAPGQLMAAGRLDIPTIVVACGYQPSGQYRGAHCDIEDVFLQAGHVAAGRTTVDELTQMSENAILGPGVCAGMGTANTMHIVTEALGMSLPGTTPTAANGRTMWDAVRRSGERVVEMVGSGPAPRRVLRPQAFENAVIVTLAVGGSVNAIKHLQAVAEESRCDVDVQALFEKHADAVPSLAAVRPNGPHSVEELDAAGGARAVMKQLEPLLRRDAMTVTGRTVGEELEGVTVADEDVVRPLTRPFGTRPTITVVRGSLASDGAVVKRPVGEERAPRFTGPAKVFPSRDAALRGLRDGEVEAGQVVVMRGLGPRGAPGMAMASAFVFALDGAGLGATVAVVTDGQLSGLVNHGLVVGEVSPEAADGGPLALVEDGDTITIDLGTRRADLEVADEELAARKRLLEDRGRSEEHGWLSVYERVVQPLSKGAVVSD